MKIRLGILFFLFAWFSIRAQVLENTPEFKPFPGEKVLSATSGLSLFNVFSSLQNLTSFRGQVSSGAVYGGSVETFLRPYLSVAVGYHQQTVSLANNGNGYLQITRMNAGPRINFRLYKRSRFDFLLGVRAGFTWHSFNAGNVNLGPDYQEFLRFQQTLNLQLSTAIRIYLTRSIGIVLESGVGVPFFLNGGICYRFLSRDGEKKIQSTPDLRNRGTLMQ